jgi:DNA-binding CsgD family transcriptional regulator
MTIPPIQPHDHDLIGSLIDELLDLRYTPHILQDRMLKGLIKLVDVKGPSSIVRLTGFFSEGGRFVQAAHTNHLQIAKPILDRWYRHIKSQDSPIEKGLFRAYSQNPNVKVGFGRSNDLLDEEMWQSSSLFAWLAKKAVIGDMGYLWIRCAKDDLWVLCLRRWKNENDFSPYECEVLKEFGFIFSSLRRKWYLSGLEQLTRKEQEVVRELATRKPHRVGAANLFISQKTFDRHIENICAKLSVAKSWEIIPKLEELTQREFEAS